MMTPPSNNCSLSTVQVAIIGAGVSGLAAARTLYQAGFTNVSIFEADSRIGGRINTVYLDDGGFIEMGAQWLHGQSNSKLYTYAAERGLVADISTDYGVEGEGSFCTEHGYLVNNALLEQMLNQLKLSKNWLTNVINEQKPTMAAIKAGQSAYDYFYGIFQKAIQQMDSNELTVDQLKHLEALFRWFILFEVIDNSCDSLQDLSLLSYSEWNEPLEERSLVNLKRGYHEVCQRMTEEFPAKWIYLRTSVTKIEPRWCEKKQRWQLYLYTNCDEQRQIFSTFDHVIITCSIGFLRENLDSGFFAFQLPPTKVAVIRSLGFGTINKIFLRFKKPFWFEDEKGFLILWDKSDDNDDGDEQNLVKNNIKSTLPNWVRSIQSFDLVRGQTCFLMAWVGGIGAQEMEQYSDTEIGQICTQVLRQVVPNTRRALPIIENPCAVYVTRWHSAPYIRGSYTNRSIAYEQLPFGRNGSNRKISLLRRPIRCKDIQLEKMQNGLRNEMNCTKKLIHHNAVNSAVLNSPVVLFAGEATDWSRYSTTDGAFRSGCREARRLIRYYHYQKELQSNEHEIRSSNKYSSSYKSKIFRPNKGIRHKLFGDRSRSRSVIST